MSKMTEEELDEALRDIEELRKKARVKLFIKYANDNNPYCIGDIIEDHIGKIKIDEITIQIHGTKNRSSCIYKGPKLRKDNTPFKDGSRESIFQTNNPKLII